MLINKNVCLRNSVKIINHLKWKLKAHLFIIDFKMYNYLLLLLTSRKSPIEVDIDIGGTECYCNYCRQEATVSYFSPPIHLCALFLSHFASKWNSIIKSTVYHKHFVELNWVQIGLANEKVVALYQMISIIILLLNELKHIKIKWTR